MRGSEPSGRPVPVALGWRRPANRVRQCAKLVLVVRNSRSSATFRAISLPHSPCHTRFPECGRAPRVWQARRQGFCPSIRGAAAAAGPSWRFTWRLRKTRPGAGPRDRVTGFLFSLAGRARSGSGRRRAAGRTDFREGSAGQGAAESISPAGPSRPGPRARVLPDQVRPLHHLAAARPGWRAFLTRCSPCTTWRSSAGSAGLPDQVQPCTTWRQLGRIGGPS